ncbi:MAG TPA: hypothetical protein VM843_00515, partial [Flavisolibacter sp.]|nr:hypothetical protein [Flavisolibacter sp.]
MDETDRHAKGASSRDRGAAVVKLNKGGEEATRVSSNETTKAAADPGASADVAFAKSENVKTPSPLPSPGGEYGMLVLYAASYLLFFAALLLGKSHHSNRLIDERKVAKNPLLLIGLHVAGIILFGTIPILLDVQTSSTLKVVTLVLSVCLLGIPAAVAIRDPTTVAGSGYSGGILRNP